MEKLRLGEFQHLSIICVRSFGKKEMLPILNTGSLNIRPTVFSLSSPFVCVTESNWIRFRTVPLSLLTISEDGEQATSVGQLRQHILRRFFKWQKCFLQRLRNVV